MHLSDDRRVCERDLLHLRMALHIAMDEAAIDALASALAVLRESGHPDTALVEEVVRTHRIGILKQRAILGAAGLDV